MEQINFSILERIRWNGTDINHLYIDGQLVWLKHTSGFYYLGQTLYCNGGPLTLNKLARTLDVSGINESGDLVTVNVQTDSSKLSFNPSDNTTAFQIGQIIYVDDIQATIDGIVGNQLYYTLVTGATGDLDSSIATNVSVGRGTSDTADTTAEVDTTSIPDTATTFPDEMVGRTIRGKQEKPARGLTIGGTCVITEINGTTASTTCGGSGITLGTEGVQWELLDTASVTVFTIGSVVYVNGKQAIIQGEDSDTIFIQYVDGSGFDSIAKDDTARLSFSGNVTGYNIGDTIYVNGRQAEVTGVAGAIVTYKYTDNTYGSTDTGTLHGERTLSTSPSTFGGNVGGTIYKNGQPGTILGISGNDLTVRLNDGTEEIIDLRVDVTVGLEPNTTGYDAGDIFYLNGVKCTVIGVTGDKITFRDHYGTETTVDPTTLTGVSITPSNFTIYTVGQTIYHNGTAKQIYTIEGNIITFQDGTIVDYSTHAGDLSIYAPNTTSFNIGDTVYVNGTAKTISQISGDRLFLNDGTELNEDDSSLSTTPTSVGGSNVGEGGTLWVGDQEKTITKIEGGVITFDDETTVQIDDPDIGTDRPNFTGFSVGQSVYVGTSLKTIQQITGYLLEFTDGTQVDASTPPSPTTVRPNYTSFTIGQSIFVGIAIKTINDILGNQITFSDGSSADFTTATNLSLTAPNQTSFDENETVWLGTTLKTIQSILGSTLTFTDGSTAEAENVTTGPPNDTNYSVGQELYIDGVSVTITSIIGTQITFDNGQTLNDGANNVSDGAKYLGGNINQPIYKNLVLGYTSGGTSTKVTVTGIFNDGTLQFTPAVGGATTGNWSPNTEFTWIDPADISQAVNDGDTLYINGTAKTIAFIDGDTIHFADGSNILSSDSSVSTVANTSGYDVGDELFVNGQPATVTSVAGSTINYQTDSGTAGTGNPNTNPGSFKADVFVGLKISGPVGHKVRVYGANGTALGSTFTTYTFPANGSNPLSSIQHNMTISEDIQVQVEAMPLWTHMLSMWTTNSQGMTDGTALETGPYQFVAGDGTTNPILINIRATVDFQNNEMTMWLAERHADISTNSASYTGKFAGFQWDKRFSNVDLAVENHRESSGAVAVPIPNDSTALVVTGKDRWASGSEIDGLKVRRYWTDEEFNSTSAQSGYDSRSTAVMQDSFGEFLASHHLYRETDASGDPTIWSIESQKIYDIPDSDPSNTGREIVEVTDWTGLAMPGDSDFLGYSNNALDGVQDWPGLPGNSIAHLGNLIAMGSTKQANGDLDLVLWVYDTEWFWTYTEAYVNSWGQDIPAQGKPRSYRRLRRFVKTHSEVASRTTNWVSNYQFGGGSKANLKEGDDSFGNMVSAVAGPDDTYMVCSSDASVVVMRNSKDVIVISPDRTPSNPYQGFDLFELSNIYWDHGGLAISGDGNVIATGHPSYGAGSTSQGQPLSGRVCTFVRTAPNQNAFQKDSTNLGHPDDGMSNKRSSYFGEQISLDYDGSRMIVGSSIAQIDVGGFWIFERGNNNWSKSYSRYGTYGDEGYGSAVRISSCGSYVAIGVTEYEASDGSSYNGGRVEFWEVTSTNANGTISLTKKFTKRADDGHAWRGGKQWHVDLSENAQSVSIHFPRAPRTVAQAEQQLGDVYPSPDGNVVFGHTDVYYTGMGKVSVIPGGQTVSLPYKGAIIIGKTANYIDQPYPTR